MTAPETVKFEGTAHVTDTKLFPHVPFGKEIVGGKSLGPRGEPLVEPKIIPPFHGYQISKPLMGKFVRNNNTDTLFLGTARHHWIDQQFHFTVRHQTPILHSPHRKLRNGHHIQFGQRIRSPEKFIVQVERPYRTVESEVSPIRLPRRRVHPDHRPPPRLRLHEIELSHAEGEQIGRHPGGVQKLHLAVDGAALLFYRPTGPLRHVAETRQFLRDHERHAEDGFDGGFVDAGEGAAGVHRFELRAGHDFGGAVYVLVAAAVESGHLIVQDAGVDDGEVDDRALGHVLREAEGHDGLFRRDVELVARDGFGSVVVG
mmetsp:Transcript_16555/g.37196  ORF Transcript_16555/g.37196 Transcript_16555/m.37196 type:complete len:315 (-) Transcript_16555:387-1331(-)